MRVIFMGTPEFAGKSLEQLVEDGFDICAVFTKPDRARGRGMETSFSPVKSIAIRHDLPIYQPETLKDPDVQQQIRELSADIIAVVAYGLFLPETVIQSTKYGAVNLHGSLLPHYRGAAPVQWAVLNGDRKTGVSTFYLTSEMDAGDVIYQKETEIGEMETSGQLLERLAVIGAELLAETLRDIDNGSAPRMPQNSSEASYVTRLGKELSPINWSRSPREIVKWICGLQPWPTATMELDGKPVKVYQAEYSSRKTDAVPGTILSAGKNGIEVACGNGECLYITEIQYPGKRRMPAADFLRGHRIL